MTFGIDMSPSVHIDNKNKDTLILSKSPTQRLDDTRLTAEAKYSSNFSRSNQNFYLNLHYNGSNTLLFVNATNIYKLKAKDSATKKYPLFRRYFQQFFSQ